MNKDFCFNELVNKLDVFDYDTYRNDKTLFFATVTNVNTGKPEYKNISDLSKKSDMEYLRASGSMPFVSKIVKVDDNYYLDGALSDSIPINKALKDPPTHMNIDGISINILKGPPETIPYPIKAAPSTNPAGVIISVFFTSIPPKFYT